MDHEDRSRAGSPGPRTLSLDVGGSGLKAAVLGPDGGIEGARLRIPTPSPAPPDVLLDSLAGLAAQLPAFDRIAAGFPGVIRSGHVLAAVNLGAQDAWRGFDITGALEQRLGKPARVLNDAEVQGLGVIEGRGLEMVVTLGTGFGTGLFLDGRPTPHLEIAHHPFRRGDTYEDQLGEKALKKAGAKKWNRRLLRAIETLRALTNFERLYLGGGNARAITFEPDADVTIVSNTAGILGGIALWRDEDLQNEDPPGRDRQGGERPGQEPG
ncbi:MAG: ROK family protein [Gemmatimonadetes bacterium]|nr:ROK family protein [Gemmatimonadota bacterium]